MSVELQFLHQNFTAAFPWETCATVLSLDGVQIERIAAQDGDGEVFVVVKYRDGGFMRFAKMQSEPASEIPSAENASALLAEMQAFLHDHSKISEACAQPGCLAKFNCLLREKDLEGFLEHGDGSRSYLCLSLAEDRLYRFDDSNQDSFPIESFVLGNARASIKDEENATFELETASRKIVLRAKSAPAMHQWLSCIDPEFKQDLFNEERAEVIFGGKQVVAKRNNGYCAIFPLEEEASRQRFRIGRDPWCEISLQGDRASVSRLHAILDIADDDCIFLTDMSSFSQKTIVNGHNIDQIGLNLSDKIQIGSFELTLSRKYS